MQYAQISAQILCDLLDSKSKITDLKMLVDDYAPQLKEIRMLDKMVEILYSTRYHTTDREVISNIG